MRVGILVNDFASIAPSQSTAVFAHRLHGMGHRGFVFGVTDLGIDSDGPVANARTPSPTAADVTEQVRHLKAADATRLRLDSLDTILVRTNPARDARPWAHDGALQMMTQARARGVYVVNDPDGLRAAGSKLFAGALPPHVSPPTLVSADRAALEAFVCELPNGSVVKPALGTRGNDVFKLTPDTPNLRVILDVLLRQGFVVAQEFVPEARNGDTRVLVLDGHVLERGDAVAAVQRVPHGRDFRSNIHAGGTATPGKVTPAMRRVVRDIAPTLDALGLRLVGLDFIGDVVCEVNVYSTGGFADAELFTGVDFAAIALDALLQRPA